MISRLKKIFASDGREVDLSRRKFIGNAAALTALAITATTSPKLAADMFESLEKQIASGAIRGQTFWLTEPVVIDIPGVIIENCKFIVTKPMPHVFEFRAGAENCLMRKCSIDTNGFVVDTGVRVTNPSSWSAMLAAQEPAQ